MPKVVLLVACALALAAGGCGGDSSAEPVVIWAVGDGGVANEPSRQVASRIERDAPDHVIYLGDVYETGTPEEFEAFGNVYGELLKRTWPTPGGSGRQEPLRRRRDRPAPGLLRRQGLRRAAHHALAGQGGPALRHGRRHHARPEHRHLPGLIPRRFAAMLEPAWWA